MKSDHEGTTVEMMLRGFHLPTMAALYEPTMRRAESEGWSHRHVLEHLCQSEATDREQRRIGRLALAGDASHRLHACSFCQQPQLFELTVEMRQSKIHTDQEGGSVCCVAGGCQMVNRGRSKQGVKKGLTQPFFRARRFKPRVSCLYRRPH